MGAEDVLEKFLEKEEIKDFGEDLKEFRKKIFLEKYLPSVAVFPKVRELFERLKADGFQTALASSASEKELGKYREKLKIADLLDKETNADEADNAKPEPDIFLAAFGKLKGAVKEIVLIVAEAAVKAKIEIVGVESGGWSEEKLREKGCSVVFASVEEIFENYDRLFAARIAAR
jgi:phosphoglycolate phosphatase-like HAD superfamily hydrolase